MSPILYFVILFFIICFNILTTNANELPSFVKPCKRNDPNLDKCIATIIEYLQPHLGGGIPALKIAPFDPLFVPKVDLQTDTAKGQGIDFNLYGLSKFSIKKLHFDVENNTFLIELLHSSIRQKGLYKVDGLVVGMELHSEGTVDVNYTQIHHAQKFEGKRLQKNGKEYIMFETVNGSINIEKFFVQADDLFPNEPELTKILNNGINENQETFLPVIELMIKRVTSSFTLSLLQSIFNYFSIDELLSNN